jgi:hypothetical protein
MTMVHLVYHSQLKQLPLRRAFMCVKCKCKCKAIKVFFTEFVFHVRSYSAGLHFKVLVEGGGGGDKTRWPFRNIWFKMPGLNGLVEFVIAYLSVFWVVRYLLPVPVAALSKAWVCDRSLAGIAVSNPSVDMDISLLRALCVVRGLCVRPIPRPEKSCRVWCVWVWSGATIALYRYNEQVEIGPG